MANKLLSVGGGSHQPSPASVGFSQFVPGLDRALRLGSPLAVHPIFAQKIASLLVTCTICYWWKLPNLWNKLWPRPFL